MQPSQLLTSPLGLKHSKCSPLFYCASVWRASVAPRFFIVSASLKFKLTLLILREWLLVFPVLPSRPLYVSFLSLWPSVLSVSLLHFSSSGGTGKVDVSRLWGVNEGGWDLWYQQPNSTPSAAGYPLWAALWYAWSSQNTQHKMDTQTHSHGARTWCRLNKKPLGLMRSFVFNVFVDLNISQQSLFVILTLFGSRK